MSVLPCADFRHINDTTKHAESSELLTRTFKANETISGSFTFTPTEAGEYILDIHYHIEVDSIPLETKSEDISIEVK